MLLRALLILIGSFFLLSACNAAPRSVGDTALAFVGGDTCINCHTVECADWQGSHHDLAMQHAQPSTVLGNFDNASFTYFDTETRFFTRDGDYIVRTAGADGELVELTALGFHATNTSLTGPQLS
jgi:hypothetical protein